MKQIVVVADMKIGKKEDVLVTHALGSCLGLMVYDPEVQIGGMLHAMLPLSKINREKAETNPFMFVDTGVTKLFTKLYELGCKKSRLMVKVAGCASPLGGNEMFRIGERNYLVLKKILWKNNVLITAEDIGGTVSRTVYFDILKGKITIKGNGTKSAL